MPKTRLLDRLRNAIRIRQYSLATEKAYVGWVRRLILFHGKRHHAENRDQSPFRPEDQFIPISTMAAVRQEIGTGYIKYSFNTASILYLARQSSRIFP